MDLLASKTSGSGSGLSLWIMLALLVAAMYFLMIRPQQKRNRRIADMQSAMGPGDEVVTIGGLYGTIQSVDDDTVMLEIAPDVVTRYARAAISKVVESATESDESDESDEYDESEESDETVSETESGSSADDDEVTVKKVVNRG